MAGQRLFVFRTHGGHRHSLDGGLSTNGCAYPHIRWPYPHAGDETKPAIFLGKLALKAKPGPAATERAPRLDLAGLQFGVEHLPERADIAAEVVVLGHLALDLFAAVQDRGVVAAAESLTDP